MANIFKLSAFIGLITACAWGNFYAPIHFHKYITIDTTIASVAPDSFAVFDTGSKVVRALSVWDVPYSDSSYVSWFSDTSAVSGFSYSTTLHQHDSLYFRESELTDASTDLSLDSTNARTSTIEDALIVNNDDDLTVATVGNFYLSSGTKYSPTSAVEQGLYIRNRIDGNIDSVFSSLTLIASGSDGNQNAVGMFYLFQPDYNQHGAMLSLVLRTNAGSYYEAFTVDNDGTFDIHGVLNVTDGTDSTVITKNGISFRGNSRINWTTKTPDSVEYIAGTSTSSLSDIGTAGDCNVYTMDEVAGSPGLEAIVHYSNVDAINWIEIRGGYDGSATHVVSLMPYDWVNTRYVSFNAMNDEARTDTTCSGGDQVLYDYSFFLGSDDNYIGTGGNAGLVRIKVNHPATGNLGDECYFDVFVLHK